MHASLAFHQRLLKPSFPKTMTLPLWDTLWRQVLGEQISERERYTKGPSATCMLLALGRVPIARPDDRSDLGYTVMLNLGSVRTLSVRSVRFTLELRPVRGCGMHRGVPSTT